MNLFTIRTIINYFPGERKDNSVNKMELKPTRTTSSKKHILNIQDIGNWKITENILTTVLP